MAGSLQPVFVAYCFSWDAGGIGILENTFGLARLMAELGNDPPSVGLEESAFSSVRSRHLIDVALLAVELFPKQMSS